VDQILTKSDVERIQGDVPEGKEFRFYTAEGANTKVEAKSLRDFVKKLEEVQVASVDFHYPRGDFQLWIKDSVGDIELADSMCFVKPDVRGEKLRQTLQNMVQTRLVELKMQK